MNRLLFLVLGLTFGFLLSRAGATTFDYYAGLFLFEDLQLLWVIVTAVVVGVAGIYLMQRLGARDLTSRRPIDFRGKPWKRGLVSGSLIFGAGWGLAGACPGTALAMVGEGKMAAAFTVAGILLGTYLYERLEARRESRRPGRDVPGGAGATA